MIPEKKKLLKKKRPFFPAVAVAFPVKNGKRCEKWRVTKSSPAREAYFCVSVSTLEHLRRRLASGRLTAMCHDSRTNAGNLQFSFALIDHAAASEAFTLARQQDCISTERLHFSVLVVLCFVCCISA